jgi:hypothetical protein
VRRPCRTRVGVVRRMTGARSASARSASCAPLTGTPFFQPPGFVARHAVQYNGPRRVCTRRAVRQQADDVHRSAPKVPRHARVRVQARRIIAPCDPGR